MSLHKIGLLGMGEVNSTIAYRLINQPNIAEIKVYSRNLEKTTSIIYDLQDASMQAVDSSSFISVTAVSSIEELLDTNMLIIGIREKFKNQLETRSRVNGLDYNFKALIPYIKYLSNYKGSILVITNPVDIICNLLHNNLGSNKINIYGIGSNLDTLRYKSILSSEFNVAPQEIKGEVIGEHGELMLPLFSNTLIKGKRLSLNREEILSKIQRRPIDINKENVRVKYGVSSVVVNTINQLLGQKDGHNQLSCFYDGIYIGMPIDFTKGIGLIKEPEMDTWERERFSDCKNKLESIYNEYLYKHAI